MRVEEYQCIYIDGIYIYVNISICDTSPIERRSMYNIRYVEGQYKLTDHTPLLPAT